MTVWRKGMLACCIYGGGWETNEGAKQPLHPEVEDILMVTGVQSAPDDARTFWSRHFGKRNTYLQFKGLPANEWYNSTAFRPVVEDKQDTALIARIKNCRPARKSVEAADA